MNTTLLQEIAAQITANPKAFSMAWWPQCIAGIACRLSSVQPKTEAAYLLAAQKLLGLDAAQARRLCQLTDWPMALKKDYFAWRDGTLERAKVAARFKNTKGAE